ncbi:hypothetical protein ACQP2P_34050 [Dactylosporangium sp. CA-139114]|uniref:hypothetical protein n=1 Tax=Dactylosporangium sp. CA-139114 TaxID=3239931 RepID=UPI003D989457
MLQKYQSEIVFAIVGIVAPYILTAIVKFFAGMASRRRVQGGPNAALIGVWYAFHFSRVRNVAILRREVWNVRLDRRGRLVVTATDPGVGELSYSGHLKSIDSGHLACLMHGVGHDEESYIRLQHPIPSQPEIFGMEVAVNFDREIRATVWLLSREDLEPAVAERLITEKTDESYQQETRSITFS